MLRRNRSSVACDFPKSSLPDSPTTTFRLPLLTGRLFYAVVMTSLQITSIREPACDVESVKFPHADCCMHCIELERDLNDKSKLVAAIFDANCECGRVELLYQHTNEHFRLISSRQGKMDSCEAFDTAGARNWIARNRDKATVVVDV